MCGNDYNWSLLIKGRALLTVDLIAIPEGSHDTGGTTSTKEAVIMNYTSAQLNGAKGAYVCPACGCYQHAIISNPLYKGEQ